ncbi:MAG: hypothetical protein AABW67_04240 [Nanoarchaeota archaeon]
MCKKTKGLHNRIDKCMNPLINWLNGRRIETLACCCGHNRYPMTIVVLRLRKYPYELLSQRFIPRRKKFYIKDKQGYYYIPEVCKEKK